MCKIPHTISQGSIGRDFDVIYFDDDDDDGGGGDCNTHTVHKISNGCESWSLTLREECRLRGFENRVLRRIFGPKRDDVSRVWRRLHNEELYDLY
jgi:hypothetical protein